MPQVRGRSLDRVVRGLFSPRSYVAAVNMLTLYRAPLRLFYRYLFNAGRYPYRALVRTPLGPIDVMLYSSHDLLTLNEIFCRLDYAVIPGTRVVVDVGSNIGISALYFLTRDPDVFCHLFEPVPANVERLRENLGRFDGRYALHEAAVAEFTGRSAFAVEPTGRYGGIGTEWPDEIEVSAVSINEVLRAVLESAPEIDILKIDVEGLEVRLVEAIDPDLRGRIRRIYIEAAPERPVLPDSFSQRSHGGVCVLDRR